MSRTGMLIQTATDLGEVVRKRRKALGMTLEQCAAVNGVGVRFLSELERGKPTAELGKALLITRSLGIELRGEIEE